MMKHGRFLYRGQWLPLHTIAAAEGMHHGTLHHRVTVMGMSLDDAIKQGKRRIKGPTRAPKLFEFRGEQLPAAEIAKRIGKSVCTVYRRVSGNRVLDGDELIDPNPDLPANARIITLRGKSNSLAGWSKETGVDPITISQRIKAGWPIREALTIPTHVGGFDTITYDGRTMTISAWAKERGLSAGTLRARLDKCGWDAERALFTPVRSTKAETYTFGGKTRTLSQWAAERGINHATLRDRIRQHGWTIERALTEPVNPPGRVRPSKPTTAVMTITTGGSSSTLTPSRRTGGHPLETDLEGTSP